MGNIQGRFADQNDIVTTSQVLTANNNQTALNSAILETDALRGTPVIFQPTGLLATPANIVPNVTSAAQGDIGAALGGVGQEGTASQEPGGGGNPCFIATTSITTVNGPRHIRAVELGEMVWGFDKETGERCLQKVVGKWEHLVQEFTLIEFMDGETTGVVDIHRYWIGNGRYFPIKDISAVLHWDANKWIQRPIIERTVIKGEIVVYNLTVENTNNYIANGDAVSNLKPLGGNES